MSIKKCTAYSISKGVVQAVNYCTGNTVVQLGLVVLNRPELKPNPTVVLDELVEFMVGSEPTLLLTDQGPEDSTLVSIIKGYLSQSAITVTVWLKSGTAANSCKVIL